MKRSLAVLLCVFMFAAMLPTFAAAQGNSYAALGDSITTGYGLADGEKAFTELLAETNSLVLDDTLARDGKTSGELLEELEAQTADGVVAGASVVTITIGGNDLMHALYSYIANRYNEQDAVTPVDAAEVSSGLMSGDVTMLTFAVGQVSGFAGSDEAAAALGQFAENLGAIVGRIRELNPSALIVVANQYNPYRYLAEELASNMLFGGQAKKISDAFESGVVELNNAITASAGLLGYSVADVYSAFAAAEQNPCNASFSPSINLDFHPNAFGHSLIASAMGAILSDAAIGGESEPETGDTTETVTAADGSTVTTVKRADGSTSVTVAAPDGSGSVTEQGADGSVRCTVTLSAAALEAAGQSGVALPVSAIAVADDSAAAAVITVNLPDGTASASVLVPTNGAGAGTVALLVGADGSEQVIKDSLAVEGNLVVTISNGDTIKIVNNGGSFSDIPSGYWGADAVAFVSSRGLIQGTGADTFSPNAETTRAMIVTVLARLAGVDTSTGSSWYEAGRSWAIENGISDGSNMEQSITREQLVTMMWRYVGEPEGGSLGEFADAASVSGYAQQAMAWATNAGLITGVTDDTLSPQGMASRAQVATILMRFVTGLAD